MNLRSFTKPNRFRIKNWRNATAVEAVSATKAFRSGKLKSASANEIIVRLQEVPK